MATTSILAKMAVLISANNAEFARAMNKSQKDLADFTNGIKRMAKTLGVAFGVREIADFTLHVSRLAGQAEAVRAAFERLPDSTRLMNQLKDATGGTVSELELMKRAVQASNFDISLEALPRLLEFATLRAQQTGQSVDYLVDSIVTGIGRKSKLILDNLGISAVQLDKALGGVSIAAADVGQVAEAVGQIAQENLKNMAAFSENADTKMQRLAASWEDLKVAIGEAANSTGLIDKTFNMFTRNLKALSGDEFNRGWNEMLRKGVHNAEILNRLAGQGVDITMSWQELLAKGYVRVEGAARKYEKVLQDIQTQQKNMALASQQIDPLTGAPIGGGLTPWNPSMIQKRITTLGSLKEKEKELLQQFDQIDEADKKRQKNKADEIILIREQIAAIEDLLKVEKERVALSLTSQRAIKDETLKNVKTFGELITKTSPDGATLQNFAGVAGERTGLSAPIAVDLERMGALAQKMVEVRNASLNATTEMKQHWIDLSGTVGGSIASLAEGLGAAAVGAEGFGENIIRAFTGFIGQFGQMLIASGIGALALQRLITNPVTAIAAGTALVALAGATSASVSRAHSGLTGGGGGFSAPGRLPSESGGSSRTFIRGYQLEQVLDKNGYRRSRLG